MRLIIVIALLFAAVHSSAQKISGGIIYTLGKDTTLAGNYHQEGNVFYIHVVAFSPSLNVHQWRGRFFENGEIEMAEGLNYRPGAGDEKEILLTYRMHSTADSTYLEQKRGETVTKQQYKQRTMITNSIGGQSMFYLMPLLAKFGPSRTGDSIVSTHIVLNSARPFVIRKVSADQMILGSTVMGFHKLNMNAAGKVVSLDAIGTSSNIKGQIVPAMNIDSVIRTGLARESARPPLGAINKLDSVQKTVNGVSMKIKYSRPSVRGRVIYGEVVPWNRWWRTGANAATRISIDKPIYIDGKELPAGNYSIWTMPSKSGWKMMFNKEANIWGTEYKPEHDVLVVNLATTPLREPVELFTFNIQQQHNTGEISFMWEKLKGSVRFTTSR